MSLQCSCWCSQHWCCRCNSCWQCCCLGGRSWCRCSWCYITNVGCVWFDSIQMKFSNVVMSTSVLSTPNDLDQVRAIIGFVDDGSRKPQIPGITEDRYSLASKEWGFLWQPHWSWLAHWLRWSHSALACGSVCLIHCGIAVHSTHWFHISTGKCKCALTGMLWYASRAKYGSWPEHLVWVSNPLMVLMAASAWPLLLELSWYYGQTSSLWQTQWRVHWQTGGHCCYGVPLGCHVLQRIPSGLRWSWRHCNN